VAIPRRTLKERQVNIGRSVNALFLRKLKDNGFYISGEQRKVQKKQPPNETLSVKTGRNDPFWVYVVRVKNSRMLRG